MSTRAAIVIKDAKNKNNLYRHSDGYPEGLGEEIKEFLDEYKEAESISADALAMDMHREEIASPTYCIHSDEEYLYIIDCEKRKLTCYDVGIAWKYHQTFTKDGKKDYCSWARHLDINNIPDPIIEFEYAFGPSKSTVNSTRSLAQKWINEGGTYYPIRGDTVLLDTPGPGIYNVVKSSNPMDARIGLVKIGERFEFNFKVYELGCEEMLCTIQKTWESDVFTNGDKNLGVIFNGLKGTGKTLSAKLLCNALNMPVVIVQYSYEGLVPFLQSLCFECVVFIDEAEKTFKKGEADDMLLRIIDGVYNSARKLYVLTTNQLTLNDNLLGRPGRIRYRFEFNNLMPNAIKEYLDDNLLPEYSNQRENIIKQVDLLEISTIDILKALVDEVNIHGHLPEQSYMNIPTAKYVYEILEFYDVNDIESYSDIKAFISEQMLSTGEKTISEWLKKPQKDDPKEKNEALLDDKYGYVGVNTLNSQSPMLWRDCSTSRGTILTEPTPDGYFLISSHYGGDSHLCLLLNKKDAPSLYGGALAR